MGDPVTWAVISGLAIAGASTGYTISSGERARSESKKAANEQDKRQKQLEASLANQQQTQETEAASNTARDAARNRQRQRSAGATGRRDTILTGPLGLQGSGGAYPGKTLLGE